VSRSVVRNSLNEVARNQNLNIKAAKISQKTLDDAMKQLIHENLSCKNENRTTFDFRVEHIIINIKRKY
jgi:hypothetical protein